MAIFREEGEISRQQLSGKLIWTEMLDDIKYPTNRQS